MPEPMTKTRASFNLYQELFTVVRMKFETSLIDNNALILYINMLYFANRFRWKPFTMSERKLVAHCDYGRATFMDARTQLKHAHLILHETNHRNAPTYFMVPVHNNIEQLRGLITQGFDERFHEFKKGLA